MGSALLPRTQPFLVGDLCQMFDKLSLNEAFHSVKQIAQSDVHVSVATLYNLVRFCIHDKNISIGRQVHALIVECGYESNLFLGSHMIRLFAVCGDLVEANQVFGKVQEPDVFTWNAIISAHAKLGNDDQALALYSQLNYLGSSMDAHIMVAVLKACHSRVHLLLLHAQLTENGLDSSIYILVTLLDGYAKCGNRQEVRSVFYALPEKSVVAWNAMIKGCTHHGHLDDAFQLFLQMQMEGVLPNHITFVTVLKTCSDAAVLSQGKIFHSQLHVCGFCSNISVHNSLIDMYAKCSHLDGACREFGSSPMRDVVTWNVMTAGYVQHGLDSEALSIFRDMQQSDVEPDQVTFSTVLNACSSSIVPSGQGMLIHGIIVESGLETDMYVSSSLINMYAKWGCVDDGRCVFAKLLKPNLIMWSAMIACYAQNDLGLEAIDAFHKMQLEGLQPNQVLYASILRACSDLVAFDLGKLIHAQIIESSLVLNVFVASTLIDMYTKCNSSADAYNVFDRLSSGNVVTWSAMIAGHVENGRNAEALNLFNSMQDNGVEPNEVTFIALLSLCSNIAAVREGMLIHAHIIEMGLEVDTPVSNSIVDMYATCGLFNDACNVLGRSTQTTVVTWNALIAGCTKHSDYGAALNCLKVMLDQSVEPNDITFVSILSLCNHMGLVNEGHFHFTFMRDKYDILPIYEHYMCTIDLLGRAGFLDEAEDLVNTMPSRPDIVALASLLSHCKTYENADLARQCFNGMVAIDSRHASGFTHMSKIYASEGMKDFSDLLEDFRSNANAWKKPAMACLEVEEERFEFVVGDASHEDIEDVCTKLKSLTALLREEGYLPKSDLESFHQSIS